MYEGSLIFTVILFILIFLIAVILVVVSDTIFRLPGGSPFDKLSTSTSDLTFSTLVAIFVIGFVLSLGVLIYYRGTLTTGDNNTFISGARVDTFIWVFLLLIIISMLIILGLTLTASSNVSNFISTFSPILTTDDLNNVQSASSELTLSIFLDIAFLFFCLVMIGFIAAGI